MCAIVGRASPEPAVSRAWLTTARAAMRHRGPDDTAEWWSSDGRVGYGHCRLAILDLTAAGRQPMTDERGLCITFNGEIYNFRSLRRELEPRGHVFRSASDTEVLLAAYREWGDAFVARLTGMFALAIHDAPARRVLLARDRAGEKPLFYAIHNRILTFASELKGLIADPALPRQLNRAAFAEYLARGFVGGDRCLLSGVHKLPPAHILTFDLTSGESQVSRYWTVPEPDPGPAASEAALVEALDHKLDSAVRGQLAADVPVGILLSGGIDSSLITAMAARTGSRIRTFTVRFPGAGKLDESRHARQVSAHFATDHTEIAVDGCAPSVMTTLARQFDEPMADSSAVPMHLLSMEVRTHCKVVLGGDGGDELFGGYGHYRTWLRQQRRLAWTSPAARRMLAAGSARWLAPGVRGRNFLINLGWDLACGLPDGTAFFDRRSRDALLASPAPPLPTIVPEQRHRDLVQRATRTDFASYLPDDILVKVDRASMLASVEVRAPFLDHHLIEFAFGAVPSAAKVTTTDSKVLLKTLARRLMPAGVDLSRKQGFSAPLAQWLRSPAWQRQFRDVLSEADPGLFTPAAVGRLLAGQQRGRSNSERLYALVLFELWRREYRVAVA